MTTDLESLLTTLRQITGSEGAAVIEALLADPDDSRLNRINVLDVARRHGLHEDTVIAAFLHAARLNLFDMSWNVLCPGCGGVLDAGLTLRQLDRDAYHCALCAAGYEPNLDDMIEVTFTVSARVRRIAAHDADTLPVADYFRQMFWASAVDLPDDYAARMDEVTLDSIELPPGERAILSLTLPEGAAIVFDPVSHAAQLLEVRGDLTRERQSITVVLDDKVAFNQSVALQPGPLRLTFENRMPRRTLPGVWVADDRLHSVLGRRRPFLDAKRLLSNQTFRDLYRTDTLGIDQKLKLTSLTFLFTDLKGSTELYERIGDLAAFDLVKAHFQVLHDIVAAEAGAVVKTVGDAVMATFPTPDRALAAALHMRQAMRRFNDDHGRGTDDLLLKIGIHEGPCLAVSLNDRQDYFGQTVNIAARIQALATEQIILATEPVLAHKPSRSLLDRAGIALAAPELRSLRGLAADVALYAIT